MMETKPTPAIQKHEFFCQTHNVSITLENHTKHKFCKWTTKIVLFEK